MNRPTKVLLVDADPALAALLEEWLAAGGCSVEQATPEATREGFDLIVVDVPFPRQAGALDDIAKAHPGTPVLALSSSFFPGIETTGPVAQALGVAGVLPKPASQPALLAAVRRLLPDAILLPGGRSIGRRVGGS